MLKKVTTLSLIACLFNIAVLLAQQQISLTNFSSANRLSQHTVFSCFKDQYGLTQKPLRLAILLQLVMIARAIYGSVQGLGG